MTDQGKPWKTPPYAARTVQAQEPDDAPETFNRMVQHAGALAGYFVPLGGKDLVKVLPWSEWKTLKARLDALQAWRPIKLGDFHTVVKRTPDSPKDTLITLHGELLNIVRRWPDPPPADYPADLPPIHLLPDYIAKYMDML